MINSILTIGQSQMTLRFVFASDHHLTPNNIDKKLKALDRSHWSDCGTVLLGDVAEMRYVDLYRHYLKVLTKKSKWVILVPGNHEYLRNSEFAHITMCNEFSNLVRLNNQKITIDGLNFVGSTLWASAPRFAQQHATAVDYLQQEITAAQDPLIVCTHYPPSYKVVTPNNLRWFAKSITSYVSHNDFLLQEPVTTWFSGHLHQRSTTLINNIPVHLNARGHYLPYYL